MIIKTFDAFTWMSFLNINRITKFLHQYIEGSNNSANSARQVRFENHCYTRPKKFPV